MVRPISTQTKERMLDVLKYMEKEAPCTTIGKIAKEFNLTWSQARHLITQLVKAGHIIETTISTKLLWCINETAAATEIYTLIQEAWRVICDSKKRYITPSEAAQLIAHDKNARKVYAKYVDLINRKGGTLKFMTAILTKVLGKPLVKTPRKAVFYIPPEICQKEPQLSDISIRRYKRQHRNIVTLKVSTTMYNDMLKATQELGIPIAELVRMAIKRLLDQYRHIIGDNKDTDLKANIEAQ
jgi:DNA-binding MarR family transcriptional regulator